MKLFLSLFALSILLPAVSHADVPPVRFQKEYAKVVYDFAVDGGTVGAHPSIVTLPAGANGLVITNVYLYLNTKFAGAGSSVGIQCASPTQNDIFGWHDLTLPTIDTVYSAALTGSNAFATNSLIANAGTVQVVNGGQSVLSDCTVTTNIAGANLTAGKMTAIIEFFRK